MSQTASHEFNATHPLAGHESWPRTGPIYGLGDNEAPRVATFWERLGERLWKSPAGDNFNPGQARIWY
jgi:hypothetical protein